jgi:hypothetical protein
MSTMHTTHLLHAMDAPRITPNVFGSPKKQNPANAGFCDVTKF